MQRPSKDPRQWGSHFWYVMHTVCLFYPDHPTADDMSNMRNFFLSLQGLLPCPSCAYHYARMLKRHPIEGALQSKMEMIRWVHMLHNEVNRRTGKAVLPFSEYMDAIDTRRPPPLIRLEPVLLGVFLAVMVAAVIRYYHRRDVTAY